MTLELIEQIFIACGRDPEAWNGETRRLVELALECERRLAEMHTVYRKEWPANA